MENTSEIVAGLQELQNQVKYFHWQTKSYAQHQALAKVFDSITELIDTFVETLMGKYGRPSTKGQKFEMFDLEDVNIEEWTGGVCDLLISFSDVLDDVQDTDLLNLRDEMLQNFNQLKYLLTLKENFITKFPEPNINCCLNLKCSLGQAKACFSTYFWSTQEPEYSGAYTPLTDWTSQLLVLYVGQVYTLSASDLVKF